MAPTLPTRALGKNGPQVTALGFGCMGLSAFYGAPLPDDQRFAVLDAVHASGERFWDTADVYMDNEDLLGAWFRANPGKRETIFLCTKFAATPDGPRSDPAYAKQACDRSLKRLGTTWIDLYYMHRSDRKTPIEKTVQAMAELKAEGKIRHLGLSEVSATTLRRAYAVHPIAAAQMEYSPFALEIESPQTRFLATARELGVAIVAYSPLGRGLMTGQYKSPDDFPADDWRRNVPRFSRENFPKNLALVDKIVSLARAKGCTPGQLTLAWLMAQWEGVIPIPGTTKVARFEENMGALTVKVSSEEEKEIREAIESAEVVGARYPEQMMEMTFADTPEL